MTDMMEFTAYRTTYAMSTIFEICERAQTAAAVSPKSTQCSRLYTESREQDEVPYFIQFVSRISKGAGVRLSHIGKGSREEGSKFRRRARKCTALSLLVRTPFRRAISSIFPLSPLRRAGLRGGVLQAVMENECRRYAIVWRAAGGWRDFRRRR